MDLIAHPPADSKLMFTELNPKVAERQNRLRQALEQEYQANEPTSKPK